MDFQIRRGDVYYADLNPTVGSEQGARRPVVIVQNNKGNKHSPTVIIVPVTGKVNKTPLSTHVFISKSCGLGKDSWILTEQIRAIDRSRLDGYIGYFDKNIMSQIDNALSISIGL